jgi:enoyl-CoA hydratase/carnithine racemase
MIPGVGGTQTLPRRLGVGRALDLVLAGRWMDARAAETAGLVWRVVPRHRLESAALALARRLARVPPGAARAARRCVRAAHDLPLDTGISLERRLALGLERATS